VKLLTKLFINIYFLSGSRKHEYEADKYGMHLMKKSGYNPKAAVWLQKYFLSQQSNLPKFIRFITEFFSTHPDSQKRLIENQKTLEEINEKK